MGLALSILVGPLLFTLVQTSLDHGIRAGLTVGLGIWISDFFFILASFLGLSHLVRIADWQGFEKVLGTGGGIFLIALGVGALVKKMREQEISPPAGDGFSRFGVYWIRGFLINTVNPFPYFFWISVATGLLAKPGNSGDEWLFYPGVMLVIVLTDSFKVFAAKLIRPYLKPRNLLLFRKISGLALLLFGAGLLVRVWFRL